MKKIVTMLMFCAFVMLCASVNAANWDNGAPDSDNWMDAANWAGDVLPTGADVWLDNSDTAVLYEGDTDTVRYLFPQGSNGGTADLTIKGTLNTTGRCRIGEPVDSSAIVTVDGGTFNVKDHFYVGVSGEAKLVVKNGGEVNQTISGYGFRVPAHFATSTVSATVEIYDGSVYCIVFYMQAGGLIKVGSGSLIVKGNVQSAVNGYISSGYIVAMNPTTSVLDVSYDGTNTIVTTIPIPHASPYTDKWGTAALWHFDEIMDPNEPGVSNKMTADDDSLMPGRDRDLTFCEGTLISSVGAALVDPAVVGTLDFPAGNPAFGKCLQFDGIDDLLRYDGDRDFLNFDPDNVKIEAWVRLDDNFEEFATGLDYYIFSSYNQIYLRINDSATGLRLAYQVAGNTGGTYWNSTTLYSDIEVNPYQWHHVALSSYNNAITVAVNGNVIASRTLTLGVKSDPASPGQYVGAYNNYGQKPFWGYIDEVRVSEVVETEPGCGYWGYYEADFNKDCVVDFDDLDSMVSYWLADSDLDSGAGNPEERVTEQIGNYNVPAAVITPVIDGVVSAGEWSDAKLIQMVYPSFATLPNVGTNYLTEADNAADFSLFWYAKWDSNNLYLMGSIKDDIYNAVLGQDEPQLCFNYNNAGTTYLVDACVWNLRYDGSIITNTTNPAAYAPSAATVTRTTATADGYIVELKLAWDDFSVSYVPAVNDIHGFGLACQDHDAGGVRQHFYADFGAGTLQMNNLSTWNTITLVDTLASGENGYYYTDVNQDAEISLLDYATIADQWLSCTDPEGVDCVNVKF